MPKKKQKIIEPFKIWKTTKLSFEADLQTVKKEKEMIKDIIWAAKQKDIGFLRKEYQLYLNARLPLTKVSFREWIDSFVASWKELKVKQDEAELALNRLSGIPDKESWDGTFNPPLEVE